MTAWRPRFLLFVDTRKPRRDTWRGFPGHPMGEERDAWNEPTPAGRWRFVLQAVDGSSRLAANDEEPGVVGSRLELLAVIRGLEALEQPSQVTLVTSSRYVARGIRFGLEAWRASEWQWEQFGVMMPVKNADLWQRLDRALGYHEVTCRVRGSRGDRPRRHRRDTNHTGLPGHHFNERAPRTPSAPVAGAPGAPAPIAPLATPLPTSSLMRAGEPCQGAAEVLAAGASGGRPPRDRSADAGATRTRPSTARARRSQRRGRLWQPGGLAAVAGLW